MARSRTRSRAPGLGPALSNGLGFGELRVGLVLVLPLFFLYELGVLYTHSANGVDLVSEPLFELVGRRSSHFVLLQLGLAASYAGYLRWWRPDHRVHREDVLAILLESVIYALTIGSVILFVMDHLLGLPMLAIASGKASESLNALATISVVSAGAGIFEELIFRVLGMGGILILLVAVGAPRAVALVAAAVGSSFVFALAHHWGASGDTFHGALFLYRFIAGLIFAAIFYFRGLAHAVYSHMFYDFYVMAVMR